MSKKSTRTRNIEKVKRARGHLDTAANLYDAAVEVYLDQFPDMAEGAKQIMDMISLVDTLMEHSFQGI